MRIPVRHNGRRKGVGVPVWWRARTRSREPGRGAGFAGCGRPWGTTVDSCASSSPWWPSCTSVRRRWRVAAKWLHLVVGAFPQSRGSRYGVVVASDGVSVRSWGGWQTEADEPAAAIRAVLEGLWVARSFGRRVRVCVHPPEVASWLGRRAPVPDRHVRYFVQVRALSHTYRQVEFLPASPAEVELARRAAGPGGPLAAGDLELASR